MFQKRISEYHWKLVQFSLIFFAFSLPFSIKLSNIVLAVMASLLLLRFDIFNRIWGIRKNSLIVAFILLFVMYGISIIWSINNRTAFFTLEKHLALVIIPITIAANFDKISYKLINQLLGAFVFGIFASYTFLIFTFATLSQNDHTLTLSYFFRELAVKYIQLHPTYLAMYTVFSVSILLIWLVQSSFKWQSLLYILAAVLLSVLSILTGARMPLVALLLILILFVFLALQNAKHLKIATLISGTILLLNLYIAPKFDVINARIKEIKETPLTPPLGIHFNSINLRVAQLLCSKQLIMSSWILGVGIGDVQDELNNCYCENNWSPALYERNYNAHNQYLQTFIGTGILGLLLFMGLLFIPLWYSFKVKNYLLAILVIIFSFCCLTESMLEKNKGIVFYTFFSMILLANTKKDNISNLHSF